MEKSYTVGEFKTRFSDIIKSVEEGETATITYGRGKRMVAVVSPPPKPAKKQRKLGRHAKKFKIRMTKEWQMDDAELLES